MPDESLEQMREDFISESSETLQELSRQLSSLVPEEADCEELVNALFRKAHSLKGTAGMFELSEIGDVAAALENVLEEVRSGRLEVTDEVVELILEALEEIALLLSRARGEAVEADAAGLIENINTFLESIDREYDASEVLDAFRDRLPSGSLDHLMDWEEEEIADCLKSGKRVVHLSFTLGDKSLTEVATEILPDMQTHGKVLGIPPPPTVANGVKALSLLFLVQHDQAGFDAYVTRKSAALIELGQAPGPQPESARRAGSDRGDEGRRRAPGEFRKREPGTGRLPGGMAVKVDISLLDSIMNTISELYSVRFALTEIATRLTPGLTGRKQRDELMKLEMLLSRRIGEIETSIMEARLVPVSLLFNRYTGEIRRLAGREGKKIELIFEGEGTRVDRALLEEIYDPVLHLLRNAVDHGIETPARRRQKGKPDHGRVMLRARQESNHVRIDIEDDGAGFDFQRIEALAREKGITNFSRDDLINLLFEPGVSTSEEVTDISGRGVGLDEVKVHIESLRGVVSVYSRPGEGTCFSLFLPLTLAVSRGVVFEEADITVVLPLTYVEEIIPYRGRLKREMEASGKAGTIRHGMVSGIDLAELMHVPRHNEPRSMVILKVGEQRHAMIVGHVWGETDIAARPLPEIMHAPPLIVGATELHDRRPAVIVQPELFFRGRSAHTRAPRSDLPQSRPVDAGLGRMQAGEPSFRMGLFETGECLTAVPISLLSQVVPLRRVIEIPLLSEPWAGIFFERGLCHGLLRLAGNGDAPGGITKIAILRYPERCGIGITGVLGDIDVPAEMIELLGDTGGPGPVRLAARFDLDGNTVGVLDVQWGAGACE